MNNEAPGLVVLDSPPPGTFEAIFRRLDDCSKELIGPIDPRLLAIPIKNDGGDVVGGLWGCTTFKWLYIQLLLVPESIRGRGVGSAMVNLAEKEARKRSCIGAYVSAYSFQARPFYEKLGYIVFGIHENFPPGYSLLYLNKTFPKPA